MADFNGTILTDKGRNLLSKALTGTALQFTKVSIGDGIWDDSVSPENLDDLISKKIDLPINELDVTGDGTARLRFVLTNTGLEEGFFTREIGIYANDPDLGEILYAVTYSNNPDFIPSDGVVKVENVTDIYTVVSNAQNVEAVISDTVVIATKDDVKNLTGVDDSLILEKIKNVDGYNSGLDSDLVRGEIPNISVSTLKDLLDVNTNKFKMVFVKGYHTPNDSGGGIFIYEPTLSKDNHNGGTIIDPDKTFPTNWDDQTEIESWFTGDGVGNGCWVRQVDVSYINPECFGTKGDGVTDDTKSIQQAIDSFGKIELLNKRYLIHSINLDAFCEIKGNVNFSARTIHTGIDGILFTVDNYSTFLCIDETNPAIIMHNGAKIDGIAFFYPNQDRYDASNIIKYPPTIQIISGSFGNTISNILAFNPYWFIDASQTHQLLTVEHVYGAPIYRGIFTDLSFDIDRFTHIHFNPNINGNVIDSYRDYIWQNLIAFQSGKLDWGRWEKCFVYGANIGFLVKTENTTGRTINQTTFNMCGADSCKQPFIVAEDPNGNVVTGLKVINCDFVARNPRDDSEVCHAVTLYNIKNSIFENIRIWGTRGHGFVLYRGAVGWWGNSISNNKIIQFGMANPYDGNVYDAIHIENAGGELIIKDNYIVGDTGSGILRNGIVYYETENGFLQKSIISNNVLLGTFNTAIDLSSTQVTECIVDDNICDLPKVNPASNYLNHQYGTDKEFTYFSKVVYRTSDLTNIEGDNLDSGQVLAFKTLNAINNSFSDTDFRFLSFGTNDDCVFIRARNLKLFPINGNLFIDNLPTSDPGVAGQLWNDNGTLKISAG